jgi:hypothetical protein
MSEPDRSNLATRGDLFDALDVFFDRLAPCLAPTFVGHRVKVTFGDESPIPVEFWQVPVECTEVSGGLICLVYPQTGTPRWYPIRGIAWIEMAD